MKNKEILEVTPTSALNKIDKSNIATPAVSEPSELIRLAIDKGADLEKLEKLLNIKRAYDADVARKAYHVAMANFKANAPEVVSKNKKVNYATKTGGTVKYNHATLSHIVKSITAELSKNGLSVSWPSKQADGKLTVTCKITHALGHSEDFPLTGPLDESGGKNAIQSLGSTASYLERYTLLMATGLATEDQDDDGKTSQTPIKQSEPINKPELAKPESKPDDKESKYKTMLESFAKAKATLGKDEYKTILGREGYEHSNQISSVVEGNKILDIMRKRAIALKGDK